MKKFIALIGGLTALSTSAMAQLQTPQDQLDVRIIQESNAKDVANGHFIDSVRALMDDRHALQAKIKDLEAKLAETPKTTSSSPAKPADAKP